MEPNFKLNIFCNMYFILSDLIDSSSIIEVYNDYVENYLDEVDGYKGMYETERYDSITEMEIKNKIQFDSNVIFLSASTYYQSYFLDMEKHLEEGIHHLFHGDSNHYNFIDQVKKKAILTDKQKESFKKSKLLYGTSGIKSFIRNPNKKSLRLNFDGGYFNKSTTIDVCDKVGIKISPNSTRIGHKTKATIVPCFWVKLKNGTMKLEVLSPIRYCDNFNQYQNQVFQGMHECFTRLFTEYPSQWVRWSSIQSQLMICKNDELEIDDSNSILIQHQDSVYLFDYEYYDIFTLSKSQFNSIKSELKMYKI